MAPVILPSPRPGLRHTRQASYDTARHTRQASYSRSSCARSRYWATSAAPLGRVRGDAPVTSDDDGSQPEQGKEAEAAEPKLEQAERQRNKKLRRDGEARNLPREERKMTASMRQIEEMQQNEKAVKAGPGSTQFEGRHENEKVGEKRWFRDACDAGGEAAGHGLRGEAGLAGDEKLEKKRKKAANDASTTANDTSNAVAWESASSTAIGRAVRNAGRRQTSPCMED
jgi:hypothetical protein